jgi:DMSO reductase anchor subunit
VHPALSVILFTTATGAGYGMLGLCGVLAAAGVLPNDRPLAITASIVFLGLISAGLLSSTAHLSHPERAWRAFSQWRSSWLSREGVAAIVTFIPAVGFAACWVFLPAGSWAPAAFGIAAAVMSIVTVCCTAMIYVSLKPIHQWHNSLVLPVYLALALMTGGLCLNAVTQAWDASSVSLQVITLAAIAAAWALKECYWRFIATTKAISTPQSAIGLQTIESVRLLDPPHTQDNYLLREMGFHIGRKHAEKLRWIARLAGFAVPLVLTFVSALIPGVIAAIAAALAVLCAGIGILTERWLFFAEAKHTVTLYYGAQSV